MPAIFSLFIKLNTELATLTFRCVGKPSGYVTFSDILGLVESKVGNLVFNVFTFLIMHQSFVTTAPPPTGKGGG